MLVSNIVPFIAAAAAVFAPAASAWDFKVKWNRKTNCAVKGGPVRYHDRGVCMPLTKTDHGVDVLGHTTGCKSKKDHAPVIVDSELLLMQSLRNSEGMGWRKL